VIGLQLSQLLTAQFFINNNFNYMSVTRKDVEYIA